MIANHKPARGPVRSRCMVAHPLAHRAPVPCRCGLSQIGPRAFAVEPLVLDQAAAGAWHLALLVGAELGLGSVGESEPESRQAEVEPEAALATFLRVHTFAFALELFGELEDDPIYQLSPGIWHPVDAFEVGVGGPIGLSEAAPDYGVVALVTWEYELARSTSFVVDAPPRQDGNVQKREEGEHP
jgi:hypothetical protein